jgi:hypothetical protein
VAGCVEIEAEFSAAESDLLGQTTLRIEVVTGKPRFGGKLSHN